ncbi:DUF1566 domain-containing protein, partial [candidate division KSB3 bacterium]|nr:DUF1566 domain-containing protein [candidate division KSB3 bacterium]MBD3323509.1 DUF1566 domain-containing protein [candidate division KSB3 bacterium]
MKTRLFALIGGIVLGMFTNLAAAEVTIPYEFRAGQAARADEVNANFTALKDAIEQLQERIAALETQKAELEAENRTLQATISELITRIETLETNLDSPMKSDLRSSQPANRDQQKPAQQIALRSEPRTVSDAEAQQVFGLDEKKRPKTYIDNAFEARGEVIVDHATGLMWQQSGSAGYITYTDAQAYCENLTLAGYNDWQLPTVQELMSLLEPEKSSNGLYINSLFDDQP